MAFPRVPPYFYNHWVIYKYNAQREYIWPKSNHRLFSRFRCNIYSINIQPSENYVLVSKIRFKLNSNIRVI